MKINLTLDFPEAKTKNELRELARSVIKHGSDMIMTDVSVINFEFLEEEKGKKKI